MMTEAYAKKILSGGVPHADAQDQANAVQCLSGYHPWGAIESAQNAEKFNHWFAKLPQDLTLVDLSPLYILAADIDQETQLRRAEKAWTPNTENLGSKYNGPLGQDREPMPHNLKKWREAVEAKRQAYLNRFEIDLARMGRGDVPASLRAAAEALVKLAKESDADRQSEVNEWDGCTGMADVPAIASALRLIEMAYAEVKAEAKTLITSVEESLWQELEVVDAVTKQLEGDKA